MTQNGESPREGRLPRASGDQAVPGVGGAPESSADGQKGLRLHAGISVIATALSILVAVVFVRSGVWPLAVVFAIIALGSLGVFAWALRHQRRGARLRAVRSGAGRPTPARQQREG